MSKKYRQYKDVLVDPNSKLYELLSLADSAKKPEQKGVFLRHADDCYQQARKEFEKSNRRNS